MILGPTFKLPQAIQACNRIKSATKREVIKFEDIIPQPSKELLEKRDYLQNSEFWNNPQIKQKLDLNERLINAGDKFIKQ